MNRRLSFALIGLLIAQPPANAHLLDQTQSVALGNEQQTLLARFNEIRRDDQAAAHQLAKEFVRRFPDAVGDDARFLRAWVAAYEKVTASRAENASTRAPVAGGSIASAAPPSATGGLINAIATIRDVLAANSRHEKIQLKDHKALRRGTENYSVIGLEGCNLTLLHRGEAPAIDNRYIAGYDVRLESIVPLALIDPGGIEPKRSQLVRRFGGSFRDDADSELISPMKTVTSPPVWRLILRAENGSGVIKETLAISSVLDGKIFRVYEPRVTTQREAFLVVTTEDAALRLASAVRDAISYCRAAG